MKLEIECEDQEWLQSLLDADRPDGVKISSRISIQKDLDGASGILAIALQWVAGVSAGVLANFIYNTNAGEKPKKIRINKIEAEFKKGEITKILIENMKQDY